MFNEESKQYAGNVGTDYINFKKIQISLWADSFWNIYFPLFGLTKKKKKKKKIFSIYRYIDKDLISV